MNMQRKLMNPTWDAYSEAGAFGIGGEISIQFDPNGLQSDYPLRGDNLSIEFPNGSAEGGKVISADGGGMSIDSGGKILILQRLGEPHAENNGLIKSVFRILEIV